MLPEIFPVRARGAGTGLSSLSNWGANFVVAQAFLPLVAITGRTTVFWGLGVICVLAGLFIYFVVPETRGRSLEDIESDLREGATAG
jgi:nitrate/nitrite transporter NarK